MVLETILGSLGGGILRLAPELLKVLDAKNERAHELEMGRLSIDADRERAKAAQSLQDGQADAAFDAGAVKALVEATRAQSVPSGVRWVDGLSSLVRPGITFSFFGLYAVGRIATMILAMKSGISPLEVLKATWTQDDQVVLAGVINFWFLGRVFDRATR